MQKIVVGVGGSSGSIYAKLLLDKLATYQNLEVVVVISENAKINWGIELGRFKEEDFPFTFYGKKDFFSPIASGSSSFSAMIICPSSMGLIGRIAAGISDDLMTRAADVMLKERRKLILVPRETPYNLIHLENMTRLTRSGAIICPASPSFYSKPEDINALCMTVVDRLIDLIGLKQNTYRWGQ